MQLRVSDFKRTGCLAKGGTVVSVFPSLYPDELLYSGFARYKRWMGYTQDQAVWQDLFGTNRHCSVVLLHPNLLELKRHVHSPWLPDPDVLLRDHTAVPYLSTFMKTARGRYWEPDASGFTGGCGPRLAESDRRRLGLGYCPVCVKNDHRQQGESYWRRIHNLPGIFACPTHAVFLERLPIPAARTGAGLVVPPELTELPVPLPIDQDDPEHRLMLSLARDVAWFHSELDRAQGPEPVYGRISAALANLELPPEARGPTIISRLDLLFRTLQADTLEALRFPRSVRRDKPLCLATAIAQGLRIEPAGASLMLHVLGKSLSEILGVPANADPEQAERREIDRSRTSPDMHLPIKRILGMHVDGPLGLPQPVLARFPDAAFAPIRPWAVVSRPQAASGSSVSVTDWIWFIRRAKEYLLTQPRRVCLSTLSDYCSIQRSTFLRMRVKWPAFQEEVNASLETRFEFAKRKARMAVQESSEKNESVTMTSIIRRTNTGEFRKQLSSYIYQLLAERG